MDALSFTNALQEVKPEAESLISIGLDLEEAAEIIASFDMRERSNPEYIELPDPVLNDLFSRYDATRVEVGMVRFHDVPEEGRYGCIIGQVEADYLVLESASGEITVRDITCPEHTIWQCARDGACLLAALAEAAKYLSSCIVADQSGSELQRQTLERCTSLAGGEAYGAFYKMLLGVE